MKSGKNSATPPGPAAAPPPANNPMAAMMNQTPEQQLQGALITQLLMGGGQMAGYQVDSEDANRRADKARENFKKKQAEELAGWTPVVTKSGQ